MVIWFLAGLFRLGKCQRLHLQTYQILIVTTECDLRPGPLNRKSLSAERDPDVQQVAPDLDHIDRLLTIGTPSTDSIVHDRPLILRETGAGSEIMSGKAIVNTGRERSEVSLMESTMENN